MPDAEIPEYKEILDYKTEMTVKIEIQLRNPEEYYLLLKPWKFLSNLKFRSDVVSLPPPSPTGKKSFE